MTWMVRVRFGDLDDSASPTPSSLLPLRLTPTPNFFPTSAFLPPLTSPTSPFPHLCLPPIFASLHLRFPHLRLPPTSAFPSPPPPPPTSSHLRLPLTSAPTSDFLPPPPSPHLRLPPPPPFPHLPPLPHWNRRGFLFLPLHGGGGGGGGGSGGAAAGIDFRREINEMACKNHGDLINEMACKNHGNLVRLLGYCQTIGAANEKIEQVLIYEFMHNGDLERWSGPGGCWMECVDTLDR
ncbi:unnamed protein product [Closterium sp. NIES-64]|nr:unnamed protein product [Closterium sp. NIES-64]